MAKAKQAVRVRMSEADVEKYLSKYGKSRDLKGKELDHAIRRCAATRWAALERNIAKDAKSKPRSGKSSKRK
jgi:hypothetical protein